jgi:hypothetical protein
MAETSRPRKTSNDGRWGCDSMTRVAEPRHYFVVAGHLADLRERASWSYLWTGDAVSARIPMYVDSSMA